jgi:hypothetical protein
MRKILLSSTALVALGVTGAQADVSISGGAEFNWQSTEISGADSVDSMNGNQLDYQISFSNTLDNGMSVAGTVNTSEAGVEEVGTTISGDFGTIGFGPLGESGDGFATALDVTPDEATPFTVGTDYTDDPGDEYVAAADISYKSPNMSGFQFAIGVGDSGTAEVSTIGGSFATAMGTTSVTVKYNMSDTTDSAADDKEAASLGLVMGMGNATLTVAQNTLDTGTTEALVSTGAALSFVVNDSLTLTAYSANQSDDKDTAVDVTDNGFGVAYTITPGLKFSVTHNELDVKNSSTYTTSTAGSSTKAAINVSF